MKIKDINCNSVEKRIINARDKAIKFLFEDGDINNISKRSTIYSFIKCTLIETGLIDYNICQQLSIEYEDIKLINDAFKSLEESTYRYELVNLKSIYDQFKNIGLNKEITTFYISFIIKKNIKYIVISKDGKTELHIDYFTFKNIEEDPIRYNLYIDKDHKDHQNMINLLIDRIDPNFMYDDNKNIYQNLVICVQRCFWRLSNYSHQVNEIYNGYFNSSYEIKESIKGLYKILKSYDINSYDVFAIRLPQLYNLAKMDAKIVDYIFEDKNYISNLLTDVKNKLKEDINYIFNDFDGKNILEKLKKWYMKVEPCIGCCELDNSESKFINYINTCDEDENNILEVISKILMGISIEDWEDKTPYKFIDKILSMKDKLENFEIDNNSNFYKICLMKSGNEIEKLLIPIRNKKPEEEMLNNIIISHIKDFNGSLSMADIKRVLLDIIMLGSKAL